MNVPAFRSFKTCTYGIKVSNFFEGLPTSLSRDLFGYLFGEKKLPVVEKALHGSLIFLIIPRLLVYRR